MSRPSGRFVLGYHELATVRSRDIYTITPSVFAHHVALVQAVCSDSAGVITFDDAHVSQMHLALPVLSEANVTAHFFVPTGRVGRDVDVATWPQLRECIRLGHRAGSHSHTHPLLTHCTAAQLAEELHTSKHLLEDQLDCRCDTISLPGGRGNARVFDACAEAGYTSVYTSAPGSNDVLTASGAPISLVGRLIVRRAINRITLIGYLRGDPSVLRRLRFEQQLKAGVRAAMGDALYQRLWRLGLRRPAEPAALPGEL